MTAFPAETAMVRSPLRFLLVLPLLLALLGLPHGWAEEEEPLDDSAVWTGAPDCGILSIAAIN